MLLFFALLLGVAQGDFSCKDQKSKNVDWWVVYNMPRMDDDFSINGIQDGTGFYYIDSNDKTGKLAKSDNPLNNNNQAIAHTLQQFYDHINDRITLPTYLVYSDDPWDSSKDTLTEDDCPDPDDGISDASAQPNYAHAKGTVFFDAKTGVWLSHSVRYFPSLIKYSYPMCARKYAQHILCMSYKYAELNNIAKQFCFDNVFLYGSGVTTAMLQNNPYLGQLFGGHCKDQKSPGTSLIDLKTEGAADVTSFAKGTIFNSDLYDNFIAPKMEMNILAQTWKRNGLPIPLNCQFKYHTNDALELKIGTTPSYSYKKDHSKWAIPVNPKDPKDAFVCIGDINRELSQYKRGGGRLVVSL